MGRLEGKVGIITGSGSGIGRACALAFGREGAAVVVADLNEEAAGTVADEIRSAGGKAIAYRIDVSDEARAIDMIRTTVSTFGRLDVLHNNAVMTDPNLNKRDHDFLKFDVEVWRRVMDVNVLGPLYASIHALPVMIEQQTGSIIMTSSANSLRGEVTSFSYGASKAALNWYTRTIATLYGKEGIRCNAILPGVTRTPVMERWATPEMLEMFEGLHLTPRLGKPEDIAGMAVYLASDESSFVTGQCLSVDGGMMAYMPHAPARRPRRAS